MLRSWLESSRLTRPLDGDFAVGLNEEQLTFGPFGSWLKVKFFDPKVTLTFAVDDTTFSWTSSCIPLPKVRVIFGDVTLVTP